MIFNESNDEYYVSYHNERDKVQILEGIASYTNYVK